MDIRGLPLRKAPPFISVFLLGKKRETALSAAFSKITPSLFTFKEGSTSHLGLLPSGKKRETALLGARNRYALRLAGHQSPRQILCGMGPPYYNLLLVCAIFCGMGPPGCCGGRPNAASKPSPCCAGWDRMGIAVYSLQLIVYRLRLISWLFADNLQISFDSLGGFEGKA